jgi:uncharacterized membrane protein YadS
LFPAIGYWLHLSQEDFLWCAIAIHDTSSVAAANKYGPQALQIATTVKLARALWIIPVALITAIFYKNKTTKIKILIALFIFNDIEYLSATNGFSCSYLVSLAKNRTYCNIVLIEQV